MGLDCEWWQLLLLIVGALGMGAFLTGANSDSDDDLGAT